MPSLIPSLILEALAGKSRPRGRRRAACAGRRPNQVVKIDQFEARGAVRRVWSWMPKEPSEAARRRARMHLRGSQGPSLNHCTVSPQSWQSLGERGRLCRQCCGSVLFLLYSRGSMKPLLRRGRRPFVLRMKPQRQPRSRRRLAGRSTHTAVGLRCGGGRGRVILEQPPTEGKPADACWLPPPAASEKRFGSWY